MQIGEAAARSRTSPRALRYYEEQGLLRPDRDCNGYRSYGEQDVLVVRQIRALLGAGFNSETVAALLPCAHGAEPTLDLCPEIVATMRRTLADIDGRMDELGRHRQAVQGLLG